VAPTDNDQLPTCLGVEDPGAAVGAGGRDARAIRADVDADDGAGRSLRSRMLIEDEELLAVVGTPHAHRSLASGARHEPSAVWRERDVGVPLRLRPGQREDLDLAPAGG
jgi:hypothetical protein